MLNYVGDLLDTCSNVYSLVLVEAVCTFAYQRLRPCMAFGMSDAVGWRWCTRTSRGTSHCSYSLESEINNRRVERRTSASLLLLYLIMLRPLLVLLQRPFPSSASVLFGLRTYSIELALREHFGLCPFLQKHLPPPDTFRLHSL